jgi:hypothetical protein
MLGCLALEMLIGCLPWGMLVLQTVMAQPVQLAGRRLRYQPELALGFLFSIIPK